MRYLIRCSKLRYAFRWFPLIVLLSVVFQLPLVQAQDNSGQQVSGLYELVVQGTVQDRICLHRTAAISVKVEASLLVAGGPAAGHVAVRDAAISVTAQDPSIASVTVGSGWQGFEPTVPFESVIGITGVAVGTTAITIEAAGRTNRFGSASAFQLRKTIPVQVVPCDYRVTMTTYWAGSMYDASVVIATELKAVNLTSDNGITFDYRQSSPLMSLWRFTSNRFRGCYPASVETGIPGVEIEGKIIDNELAVKIRLPEVHDTEEYYLPCHYRPYTGPRRPNTSCADMPDGVCVSPREGHDEWFRAEPLEFNLPLEGGSTTKRTQLQHVQGTAEGSVTITITPIRQ